MPRAFSARREFDLATRRHKHRLIFVKDADDRRKQPKMRALIRRANENLIRRRFTSNAELIGGVYAALVQYLETKKLIRNGPFDAAACPEATLECLRPSAFGGSWASPAGREVSRWPRTQRRKKFWNIFTCSGKESPPPSGGAAVRPRAAALSHLVDQVRTFTAQRSASPSPVPPSL